MSIFRWDGKKIEPQSTQRPQSLFKKKKQKTFHEDFSVSAFSRFCGVNGYLFNLRSKNLSPYLFNSMDEDQ